MRKKFLFYFDEEKKACIGRYSQSLRNMLKAVENFFSIRIARYVGTKVQTKRLESATHRQFGICLLGSQHVPE